MTRSRLALPRLQYHRPSHGKRRFALLQNGDFSLELLEMAGSHPRASDDKTRGFFKIAFRVADVDALAAALRAKGVRITHGPYNEDPEGNALQFFGRAVEKRT